MDKEQEPVAWWSGEPDTYILPDAEYQRHKANENFDGIRKLKPLYTAPPKRQPLSQEEVKRVITPIAKTYGIEPCLGRHEWEVIRAIEAAHGIGVEE